jgi:hypothetical protein
MDQGTQERYVGAHVRVPIGDEIRSGKVVRGKRELDDTVRGRANANSMLDTRTYEIEFPDGCSDEYTANVIAENMYAQCDIEGRQYTILEGVIDHRTDGHAFAPADMYIKHGSNKKVRKTTKGWHLCAEWKDGTTSWERLADLKESSPIEVAEYAATKILIDNPGFIWCPPRVLKKCTRIIADVTKRYHKRTHKFGIEVPKSWDDCMRLDKENDNTLWQDTVRKEMKNVRIEFKILNGEESIPPTYQDIRCHMIFDVNMEDLRRKAKFVAGGHTTDTPHAMAYASVVSRESVRIALTLAALNDLDVKMADKSMCGDVKEMIPSDAPIPCGKEVDLRLFVDSGHSGEQFTRRSRTGFVIYLNMAPLVWFSKRQPTVESSVFGAEFVAMKNGIETCRGLRYKLRMMGVALSGPIFVYADNMSVVHNTHRPESVLKKKSNSICYHAVRESAAMGESIIGHVPYVDNPADIFTKVVPGGQKRNNLIHLLLHDLCD